MLLNCCILKATLVFHFSRTRLRSVTSRLLSPRGKLRSVITMTERQNQEFVSILCIISNINEMIPKPSGMLTISAALHSIS